MTHMRTMVLEYYYLHFLAILGVNVGKYSSTMEHLGDGKWIVVNDYSTLNDKLCRKVGNLERCITVDIIELTTWKHVSWFLGWL